MLFFIAIFSLVCFHTSSVLAHEKGTLVQQIDGSWLENHEPVQLELEHAVTTEQLVWGLMQRKSLPANHGMTFNYNTSLKRNIWAFNCLIDLSVAFLDEHKVIREIHELKAFPHRMDPRRPVKNLNDLNLYPHSDPIIHFFENRSITSSSNSKYVLEMAAKWFKRNDIKPGDIAIWNTDSSIGRIIRTLDIDNFIPAENLPILLTFSQKTPLSVWLPGDTADRDVAFLDDNFRILLMTTLPGGKPFKVDKRPVVFSSTPAKKLLIASPTWLKRNGWKEGMTMELHTK
jgi:uncharacterized membrane protein (UPF0127 family)